MGNHEFASEIIPYLKGELPPLDEMRMATALRQSPALKAELEAVRTTLQTLSDALPDEAPRDELPAIMREKVAVTPQETSHRPSLTDLVYEVGPRRRRRRVTTIFAVAASVALAVLIVTRASQSPTLPITPPALVAHLEKTSGDVLASRLADEPGTAAWRISHDASRDTLPELFANQRIETLRGSRAVIRVGERSRLYLDEETSIALIDAHTPDASDWVRVEKGRVSFDVSPPTAASADDSAVVRAELPRPFVVVTKQAEMRVRGTRFVVQVEREVTVLVVLDGRVDVFTPASAARSRDVRKVEPGSFAALGTLADLASVLPAGPDFPPTELPSDPADATAVRLVMRPLVQVTLHVPVARILTGVDDDVMAQISLHNASPFDLELDSPYNHDNVKLHFQPPDAASPGWAPVQTVRLSLRPDQREWYNHPLSAVLHRQPFGPYYLSAVYDGTIRLHRFSHPDAPGETWREVVCRSYSPRRSVLYTVADDDDDDDTGASTTPENPPSNGGNR